MAPVAVEQDQGQDEAVAMQQAQMQQMQMQQEEQQQRVSIFKMFRHRKKIKELKKKIDFHHRRAEEHKNSYFVFLAGLALIIDCVNVTDAVTGFFAMIFTFWVPFLYLALFKFGPRSYVWRGKMPRYLIDMLDVVIEEMPVLRALPMNTLDVVIHWMWSLEHMAQDLLKARMYEVELRLLLRKQKRGKL